MIILNSYELVLSMSYRLIYETVLLVGSALGALSSCDGRFPRACPRTVRTSLPVYGSPLVFLILTNMNFSITGFTNSQSFTVSFKHLLFPLVIPLEVFESTHMMHYRFTLCST